MTGQSVRYAIVAACLLITAQFSACNSDPGPIAPPTGGAGNTVTAGGMGVQTGGVPASAAGFGAVTAGVGVAGAGVAGAGVAGAGVAGGGAAGGGSVDLTCATADKTTAPAMLAMNAAAAIVVQTAGMNGPCAFSSCHDSSAKKAKLVLDGSMVKDLHTLLTDKPACESSTLKLVDSSGGDKALTNSWLWQKLTAPAGAGDGILVTKPEWGAPAATCGQASGQAFGVRMPFSGDATLLMPTSKLLAIRDWICAGAP
jgi:hypothetical protein